MQGDLYEFVGKPVVSAAFIRARERRFSTLIRLRGRDVLELARSSGALVVALAQAGRDEAEATVDLLPEARRQVGIREQTAILSEVVFLGEASPLELRAYLSADEAGRQRMTE